MCTSCQQHQLQASYNVVKAYLRVCWVLALRNCLRLSALLWSLASFGIVRSVVRVSPPCNIESLSCFQVSKIPNIQKTKTSAHILDNQNAERHGHVVCTKIPTWCRFRGKPFLFATAAVHHCVRLRHACSPRCFPGAPCMVCVRSPVGGCWPPQNNILQGKKSTTSRIHNMFNCSSVCNYWPHIERAMGSVGMYGLPFRVVYPKVCMSILRHACAAKTYVRADKIWLLRVKCHRHRMWPYGVSHCLLLQPRVH